jgi:hypothetical protein
MDDRPNDWIELVVVDQEGNPYLGRYAIDLPDGANVHGALNTGGAVRVSGIPAGSCKVVLPDVDGESLAR